MQGGYRNLLVLCRLLVTAALATMPLAAQAASDVVGIRLGIHTDRTRIVLDMTDSAPYRIFALSQPDRLVIDLTGADWRLPATLPPAGRGLIKRLSASTSANDTARLVLELTAPARVVQAELLPRSAAVPARLYVDLERTSVAAFAAAVVLAPGVADTPPAGTLSAPEAQPQPAAAPQLAAVTVQAPEIATVADALPATTAGSADVVPPQKPAIPAGVVPAEAAPAEMSMVAMTLPAVLPPAKPEASNRIRKPLIVLDAGHGGKDPGAVGPDGTMEKEITLKMALELKRQLEATGRYRVVLTRDDDQLLALRQRIEVARTANADLFISLHADHNDRSNLRGASVYTLSENASDAEAAALAARENKEDLIAGVDLSQQNAMVTSILIDLAQRETKNLSARFASLLTAEMAQHTLLLREAHRFAGFAVLKAPDVPSVLVELGYLSNEDDEAALRSSRHRGRVGKAMLRAIDRYFEGQRGVKQT